MIIGGRAYLIEPSSAFGEKEITSQWVEDCLTREID